MECRLLFHFQTLQKFTIQWIIEIEIFDFLTAMIFFNQTPDLIKLVGTCLYSDKRLFLL